MIFFLPNARHHVVVFCFVSFVFDFVWAYMGDAGLGAPYSGHIAVAVLLNTMKGVKLKSMVRSAACVYL